MYAIYFLCLTKGLAGFLLVTVYKEFNMTKYHKIIYTKSLVIYTVYKETPTFKVTCLNNTIPLMIPK